MSGRKTSRLRTIKAPRKKSMSTSFRPMATQIKKSVENPNPKIVGDTNSFTMAKRAPAYPTTDAPMQFSSYLLSSPTLISRRHRTNIFLHQESAVRNFSDQHIQDHVVVRGS